MAPGNPNQGLDPHQRPKVIVAADPAALAKLRERVGQVVREIGTLVRTAVVDPRTRGLLATPVQGFYGGLDKGIPVSDVEAMRVALAQAGKLDSHAGLHC